MNEVKKILSKQNLSIQEIIFLAKLKSNFIKWSIVVFIILSIVITVTTKDEYTATSKFLLESQGDGGGDQLRGLAGIAGVNLPKLGGQEVNSITPDLYPMIAASDYFLLRVSNREYVLESGEKTTLTSFFSNFKSGSIFKSMKKSILRIPDLITNLFSKRKNDDTNSNSQKKQNLMGDSLESDFNQIAFYSPIEKNSIGELKSRVMIQLENKILTVETKMPESGLSAQANKVIIDQLIKYITDYQTNKKSKNLLFLESRVEEGQNKFITAQMQLANFRDRNYGIISQSEKSKEERLKAEFNLAFNLYNNLTLEYENAKIQLQNETPIFTVFEPVTPPNKPSEPIFFINLLIFTLGGFVFGSFLALGSIFFDYLK
jgi:capsule polysaccharide export protein KpsE/RkpR